MVFWKTYLYSKLFIIIIIIIINNTVFVCILCLF